MDTNGIKLQNSDAIKKLPGDIQKVIQSVKDKKAFDVVVLFLGDSQAFTDYFILCSSTNVRQSRAIVDEVRSKLVSSNDRIAKIEGYDHGEWVTMDFFDFVVHVFTPKTRNFYDLERLWGSASRITEESSV